MPTKLIVTQHYPAPPATVFALLSDRAFVEDRLKANGGLDPEVVSFTHTDSSVEMVTRQGIPASALPSVVTSFLSGDLSTQRTENWRPAADGYTADLTVTVHGAPARVHGTMSLAAEGEGSVLSVSAEATVPIPLFGGRIEKVIVEQVTALLEREEAFTASRLR